MKLLTDYHYLLSSECGDGKYGDNCTEDCACGVGAITCDKVSGCVCSSSWNGSKCDDDIDECQNDTIKQECQSKNATCSNFPGGYRCDCDSGYRQNASGICEGEINFLFNGCLVLHCSQTKKDCHNLTNQDCDVYAFFLSTYNRRSNRGFLKNKKVSS